VYEPHQTCCGQPAFNSGFRDQAAPLAERFLRQFEPYDWIVAPSGSCTAYVKNNYGDLVLSPAGRRRWEKVRERLFEATQFFVHVLGIREIRGRFDGRVALHLSCHARRELGVSDEPEILLRSIAGLDLVIPPYAEDCCGFGGTFSVKFPELSAALGSDKIAAIQSTGAEIITAVDDSCLMHLDGLIRRQGISLRTMHALWIMASALGLEK
jgi:L-lactate dehydrogenase complex protein LldE